MVSYSCPPGSLLLFTEALLHASADWTPEAQPRVAIFNVRSDTLLLTRLSDKIELSTCQNLLGAAWTVPQSLYGNLSAWMDVQHYCSVFAQLHRLALPHAAILTMPPLRRTLFRGVWSGDFAGLDGDRAVQGDRSNSEYSQTNSAAYAAAILDSSSARL